MPPPNLLAQEISKRLLYALDKLNSNFNQHPQARELLQLDYAPSNRPLKSTLVRGIFQIGQGTHDFDLETEVQIRDHAYQLEQDVRELYNQLYAEAHPPTPSALAESKKHWDFLLPGSDTPKSSARKKAELNTESDSDSEFLF